MKVTKVQPVVATPKAVQNINIEIAESILGLDASEQAFLDHTLNAPKVVSRLPRKNPYVFDPKTDKVEWRKPTPLDVTQRRINQYFGDIDPAVIVHSSKTHRTVSEAFRDAEYACSITKFKSDAQLAYEFFRDMIVGMLICGVPLLMLWALVSTIIGAYK